jgi:gamma-glutamylcyclotransferase (GGCT)/AIG2-like uncharacterized protein YtfP
MQKGDLVFVYGTLRKGSHNDLSIQSGAAFVCNDAINGLMYQRGWYPGLKLLKDNGNDFDPSLPTVVGEVYEITDPRMPGHLDAYEGYPNLYSRSQVETRSSKLVWVYTYNLTVGENELIASGDWMNQEEQEAA